MRRPKTTYLVIFGFLLVGCSFDTSGHDHGDDMGTEPDGEGDPSPTSIVCGDATCDAVESCSVCVSDCGMCADGVATPTRETEALAEESKANDPAMWIHPTDASLSVLIGTDEDLPGLHVYDLQGAELQDTSDGVFGNVDLRYGFELAGTTGAIVVAGELEQDELAVYRLDSATRQLQNVAARRIRPGIGVYGTCMYRSAVSGKYYAIVTSNDGEVEQWRLFDDGNDMVDAAIVRRFDIGSKTEGCVADDELGALYFSEESAGIWRYGAEPDTGDSRQLVDAADGEHLSGDLEGLAVYRGEEGRGYLIASNQERDEFVVYQRGAGNEYVTTFSVVEGGLVDGCESTVGIEVTSAPLGAEFPFGAFIATDASNAGDGGTNYKLVPWDLIAEATGGLTIDVRADPRR